MNLDPIKHMDDYTIEAIKRIKAHRRHNRGITNATIGEAIGTTEKATRSILEWRYLPTSRQIQLLKELADTLDI